MALHDFIREWPNDRRSARASAQDLIGDLSKFWARWLAELLALNLERAGATRP